MNILFIGAVKFSVDDSYAEKILVSSSKASLYPAVNPTLNLLLIWLGLAPVFR